MASKDSVADPESIDGVKHCYTTLNGRKYHYLLAEPANGSPRATVFLVHGWPDLSFGWRYQIPVLRNLGLRVVAPDMMGYGRTDAPNCPPEDLALYSQKRAADDIAELARQLGAKSIIVGGHDWGGFVVYKCALWHPQLISHVFSVCSPYTPPTKNLVTLDMVVERAPQFGYQKHLAGPEVEANIKSEDQIRNFLNGMYGARTPTRATLFDPKKGLDFSTLPQMGQSPLLTPAETNYYTREYVRNGLHGPLNWYRTRSINHKEELSLPSDQPSSSPSIPHSGVIKHPTLFIQASKDNVLTPELSQGMEKYIPRLTRREVEAGHWALWQAKDSVNSILGEWFEGVVFGGREVLERQGQGVGKGKGKEKL